VTINTKPYISLIVPTMRMGGLDVLFDGLAAQTFRSFELVLVDGVFDYRPRVFDGRRFDFPVRHLRPRPNPFPVRAFASYANCGLRAATGEVVIFSGDFTFYNTDAFEKHAEFHRTHDEDEGCMAPHQYVEPPRIHRHFPRYYDTQDDTEIELYTADLGFGKFADYEWSVFEQEFHHPSWFAPCSFNNRFNSDPKVFFPAGPIDQQWFHGQNESCRLDRAKRVGGWDTRMDGAHGWEDTMFARRLALNWTLDPTNISYVVSPHAYFPDAKRLRDCSDNRAMLPESLST
jgi:hypothetical protein